jgi:hypothetical protein
MPPAQKNTNGGLVALTGKSLLLFIDHEGRPGGCLEREFVEPPLRDPQVTLPYQRAGSFPRMRKIKHPIGHLLLGMLFIYCGA